MSVYIHPCFSIPLVPFYSSYFLQNSHNAFRPKASASAVSTVNVFFFLRIEEALASTRFKNGGFMLFPSRSLLADVPFFPLEIAQEFPPKKI
jgi:hypothetical protein